jgi:prefoldin subunit 5
MAEELDDPKKEIERLHGIIQEYEVEVEKLDKERQDLEDELEQLHQHLDKKGETVDIASTYQFIFCVDRNSL